MLTILNSTITGNVAGGLGGGLRLSGGGINVENTIIGVNSPDGCDQALTSFGSNLDADGSCGLAALGDLLGDPLLGPLADNSGPTQTHAIPGSSPAADAGDDVSAPPTDQRGEPRVGVSDIGAFEFQGVVGVDGDGDGFDSVATGGADCDDGDASVFPGAPEVAGDGIDQDCDGVDLMKEEEKKEPKAEEKKSPEEEEMVPGELVLRDGGQFVFWQLIPVLAGDVFGTVQIAWLWDPFGFL